MKSVVKISIVSCVFLLCFSWAFFASADTTYTYTTGDLKQTQPSRAFDTVYQNKTGTGLFVNVSAYSSSAGQSLTIYCDASNPPTTIVSLFSVSATGYGSDAVAFCPVNYYYKVSLVGGTLLYWTENYFATSTFTIASSSNTTSSTSLTYISNPAQDIFNGILLLVITAFGIMWIFRRLK